MHVIGKTIKKRLPDVIIRITTQKSGVEEIV